MHFLPLLQTLMILKSRLQALIGMMLNPILKYWTLLIVARSSLLDLDLQGVCATPMRMHPMIKELANLD